MPKTGQNHRAVLPKGADALQVALHLQVTAPMGNLCARCRSSCTPCTYVMHTNYGCNPNLDETVVFLPVHWLCLMLCCCRLRWCVCLTLLPVHRTLATPS
jgi:hypothetical protein